MEFFSYITDANNIILFIPVLFILLFTVIFKGVEASYFFVNFSRVIFSSLLAFEMYYYFDMPTFPPKDFYSAVTIVFFSLFSLFFFGKKTRFFIQLAAFNFLIFFVFKNKLSDNLVAIVSISAVLNLLFTLLYGLSIGKKPLIIKFLHSLVLLSLVFWAFKLNQTNAFYVAVLCASSVTVVSILKIVFLGNIIPNFSRQIIDVGIPLIILWLLIDASGLLFDYLSPYMSVESFMN